MLKLRRLIARSFWIVPFIYGFPALSLPPVIFHWLREPSGYQVGGLSPRWIAMSSFIRMLLVILAIVPGTITITSTGAAVQSLRGRPNSRLWAIACGVGFLVCSIPVFVASVIPARYSDGYSAGWFGLAALGLIQIAAGTLILLAFFPADSTSQPLFQNTKPARVQGDGTTKFSTYVALAVMVGALSLGDSLCRRWALHANLQPSPDLVHAYLNWISAFILAIAVHELGHIVAGKIVGMKILSVRIGPLHAAFDEGRWKLVMPRSFSAIFSGGVIMVPANPLVYSRSQEIVGSAGGVLANLLVAAIGVLGLLTAKGSAYETAWEFFSKVATINFACFVVNLIPMHQATAYSDGARIYQILTGSVLEDYRRILAMARAMAVSSLRPRDFDIKLIEETAAIETPAFDRSFLLLIASDYYFDSGHMEFASRKAREAEALCDQQTTHWAERCGDNILRATCLLRDRAIAEKWWYRSQAAKSWSPERKNLLPACAYHTISGHLPEAEVAWRAQFERSNRLPDSGERAYDLYYLAYLREMLNEQSGQAAISLA